MSNQKLWKSYCRGEFIRPVHWFVNTWRICRPYKVLIFQIQTWVAAFDGFRFALPILRSILMRLSAASYKEFVGATF